ncbi:unnamed protein product [Lymnaea stagnalis]|uniref:CTCK domain-containing protein n=1 Tax=Lymnaea stagnalis TaxID=6523 RepID=A0AAV2HM00_LYMST
MFGTSTQQRTTTNIELCTSQWSAWSDCQKTCSRVSVRTRRCLDHVKNCNCDKEVLHQGKSCLSTCSTTKLFTQSPSTGTTQSVTSSTNNRSSHSTTSSSTPDTCLCEPSKRCTTCVQDCEKSCRIFRMNASCHQEDECHTGCECPEGQLMDDHGHCSPKERCPCYDRKGKERHFNCTYLDETSCQICKCGEHGNVCQDQSTDLEVLYKFDQWSPWSDCSASCGNGTSSRYRIGQYRKCSIRLVESKECINNECRCLTQNLTVVNDGDTYRIDECNICTCHKGNLNCTADPIIKDNALWQSWGPWSPCKQHCKLYYQSRCRACRSLCGKALCHGGQCETRSCGPEPCCDVFKWSEWGDCTNRCGDFRGHRTRFRIYPFAATCPDVAETQACEKCKCPDEDEESLTEWSEWTKCYAEGQTCGWGKRTRKRISAIENPEIQREDCFLRPCECPKHLTWSNFSLCQRTCEKEPSPECYLQLSGACVCPSHLVNDGNKCIPLQECSLTCAYEDKTYQVGETVPCGDCHVCQCGRAFVFKQKKVCTDIKQCNLTTHQLVPSQDSCCVIDCVAKEICKVHRLPPSYVTIDDCRSLVKVQQEFCQGPCSASSQFVNYQTKRLEMKSCSCCVGTVSSFQKVDFKCSDSFLVTHQLPKLDCSCTACNVN